MQKMPRSIFYIIGNEAAERFSFYGMKAILYVYMTQYLMDATGALDIMDPVSANAWYHAFVSAVYFLPIFGALIADIFVGRYLTILSLSIVYCIGHLVLAFFETRAGLACGLALIAIGAGGIKPCVSAMVGDQFVGADQSMIGRAYVWFYFAINFGVFFSALSTPIFLQLYGPSVAFAVPGLLMIIATLIFYKGTPHYRLIAPSGLRPFIQSLRGEEGLKSLAGVAVLFVFVAFFWSLYDQTGSTWVEQATRLNRSIDLSFGITALEWLKFEVLPSQVQAANPVLIMTFIPLTQFVVFPAIEKVFQLTPLRKIAIGFILTAVSFLILAYTEHRLSVSTDVTIGWQLFAFAVITFAEVLVSITALEFAYTQSPKNMKSTVVSLYLLSVSLGNVFTTTVNLMLARFDTQKFISGANYFLFFAAVCLTAGVAFQFFALRYRMRVY